MRVMSFCSSALAVGMVLMEPSVMVAGGSCKTFSDKDSIFVEGIVAINQIPNEIWKDFPLEDFMAPFDKAFPWISSCLANIDPFALFLNVSANQEIGSCTEKLNNLSPPQADEMTMDSFVGGYFCPIYQRIVVPCANDILLKTITDALESSNGCCDALKQKVLESFGQDITPMANDLMRLAGDIMCSQKTYASKDTSEVTETCGASILYNLMDEEMMVELLDLLQTPEDQTCAAVTGEKYATTTGKSTLLFDGKIPLDVCYTPIAALIQHIASYPIVKQMITYDGNVKMADMFEASRCIDGGKLVEWALSQESMVQEVFRMMDNALTVNMDIYGTQSGWWLDTSTGSDGSVNMDIYGTQSGWWLDTSTGSDGSQGIVSGDIPHVDDKFKNDDVNQLPNDDDDDDDEYFAKYPRVLLALKRSKMGFAPYPNTFKAKDTGDFVTDSGAGFQPALGGSKEISSMLGTGSFFDDRESDLSKFNKEMPQDPQSGRNFSDTMTEYIRSNEIAFKDMCFHIPSVISECKFKAKLTISMFTTIRTNLGVTSKNDASSSGTRSESSDDASSSENTQNENGDDSSGSSNYANVRTSSGTSASIMTISSILVGMMSIFVLYQL
jgi:hypothetical protein